MSKQEQAESNAPPPYGNPEKRGNLGQQGYPPQQGYPQQQDYLQQQEDPYHGQNNSAIVTQPQPWMSPASKPPDYLIVSILSCICCFCPVGIFAIGYSCWSMTAFDAGDVQTAKEKGETAERLAIAALFLGIIFSFVILVIRLSSS